MTTRTERLEAEYDRLYAEYVALRGWPREHLLPEMLTLRTRLGGIYREQVRQKQRVSQEWTQRRKSEP